LLALMMLWPLAPLPAGARNLPYDGPVLHGMVPSTSPTFLAISGEGFSPGGPVQIVIAGPAGTDAHHETWTFASTHDSWGPFGAGAANLEFIPAGRVRAMILLDVVPQYGPNGSQDPAQGYVPADGLAVLRLALCSQGVDVQALDARTHTWSQNVHMMAAC
jgi:hypothetical protein